jgi:nucleotide-binding universal stress UspA family protein
LASNGKDSTSVLSANETHTIIRQTEGDAPVTGRRFLLAYNGQGESLIAWDWLEKDVREGDSLVILCVLPANVVDTAYTAALGVTLKTGLAEQAMKDEKNRLMLRTLRSKVTESLTAKAKSFTEKCSNVSIHIVHGDARQAIPRCADYHKSDTIVLGRRKLAGWKRFTASGSVSNHIVANAAQTVIIAKGA